MSTYLAGTVIPLSAAEPGAARSAIDPMFAAGGLVLSQVCRLLGIEYYNVQNWVKRGFVSPPNGKLYSKRQFCRLVIINAFKDTLEMKEIAAFLSYINGTLSDESDDLLSDDELYCCFSDAVAELSEKPLTPRAVEEVCRRKSEEFPCCADRLYPVLRIMANAYFASVFRKIAVSEAASL